MRVAAGRLPEEDVPITRRVAGSGMSAAPDCEGGTIGCRVLLDAGSTRACAHPK